ncbi:hypothetical protein M427DRAFT_54071 [Gonapodya prolifera JEL478]|uniref:G-patch domain-containing protein n=1 Tax=Gonapodya prolifera (strain JEL478) TaxID=1344416 RepID=A0A139ANE9_GONPJ|nr:hypothetical protein M427DRAFT_54071 [Gonapodya prolifera JEL478]|eukprot:KXS18269.1 hypothetical protein M427DRAFT_54071 [Gonapodya prolifera JEL478]
MAPKRPPPEISRAEADDDYMSDTFLLPDSSAKDPLPYSKKRRLDIQSGIEKGKVISPAIKEIEGRERGLNEGISEGNLGFKMLQRMGWSQGNALGKARGGDQKEEDTPDHLEAFGDIGGKNGLNVREREASMDSLSTQSPLAIRELKQHLHSSSQLKKAEFVKLPKTTADGRLVEPLPINIRQGRTGLGIAAPLPPGEANRLAKERRARDTEAQLTEKGTVFQDVIRNREKEKRERKDVEMARRIIRDMDEREGRAATPYWPEDTEPVENSKLPSETLPNMPESGEGLANEVVEVEPSENGEDDADVDESNGFDEVHVTFEDLNQSEQLSELLGYLRTTHLYCLYCGTRFDSAEEMGAECPGESRDDHDD